MAVTGDKVRTSSGVLSRVAPGIALAALVSVAALILEPLMKRLSGGAVIVPPMVIALLIGIALNRLANQPVFDGGLTWCVKKLLRIAIALLGLKVALGDITALGYGIALLVVVSMAATLASGVLLPHAGLPQRLWGAGGRCHRRLRRVGGAGNSYGRPRLPLESS